MRTSYSIVIFVSSLFIGNAVYAECPSKLPAELLYDCIVREGAGDTYDVDGNLAKWNAGQTIYQMDTSSVLSGRKKQESSEKNLVMNKHRQ